MKGHDKLDLVRPGTPPLLHKLVRWATKDGIRTCPIKWKG